MIIKNKNIIVLMAILSAMTVSAFAQPQPKWLKRKLKAGEVIAKGLTEEEARRNAITSLLSAATLPAETDTCLYNTLKARNMEFDPMPLILSAAMESRSFVTQGYYQPTEEDSVITMVSMTPASLQAFNDSLWDYAMDEGIKSLVKARELRQDGQILKAFDRYQEAIDDIAPCMYYPMATEEGDLGEILLEEYAGLFDNIVLSFDREKCPMIPGEEVPLDITIKATQENIALKRLPVKVWMRQRDAKVTQSNGATGIAGTLTANLATAPQKETAELLAALDVEQLSDLKANFATPLLKEHLKNNVKQFKMEFVSADPTPYYRFDIAPCDTLQAIIPMRQLIKMSGKGYVETTEADKADLVFSIRYSATEGTVMKAGDYKMRVDTCNLILSITDVYHDKELLALPVQDFTIRVPETRSTEKVREQAVRLILQRLLSDAPERLKELDFNKREIIFEKAKQ